MMRWLPVSFILVGLMAVSACSGPRSPEGEAGAATSDLAKQDLDKLQGTWRMESSFWNGVEDPEIAKTVTILFQDDKFIVVDRDGNRQQETFKLIPDQNPKPIALWNKRASPPTPPISSLQRHTFTLPSPAP